MGTQSTHSCAGYLGQPLSYFSEPTLFPHAESNLPSSGFFLHDSILAHYYGLTVFSQNSYVETPPLNVMAFGGGSLGVN